MNNNNKNQFNTIESIIDLLKIEVSRSLDDGRNISVNKGFIELGLDSLELVELASTIEEKVGVEIETDRLFEHSNIESLATYLHSFLNSQSPSTNEEEVIADSVAEEGDIFVIGIGCRFPGGINNPDDLWRSLINGEDLLAKEVKNRMAYKEKLGGFLEEIEYFDANHFGISPREAIYIDPQQRILLEVIWDTLKNANMSLESLRDTNTGVYVGISNNDYRKCLSDSTLNPSLFYSTGNASSVASGRISYLLGLNGPCLSIDTACSSSLVAAHLACQAIRNGECEIAIIAGVNLILEPTHTNNLMAATMLSPEGRCKSFDMSANGFVRSEGCGVILISRNDMHADKALAVIKGSAINQDGHSGGLSAPNIKSQHAVILAALKNAGISHTDVDYIEAHGSGTSIGDTIELNAIKRGYTPRENPVKIGSIKASIGHAEAASGIAGLIKTILALAHQQLPKQLHFKEKNKHIQLSNEEGIILQSTQPWIRSKRRRIAGISSFGFSGTNCHMIVAESPGKLKLSTYQANQYNREYYWIDKKSQSKNQFFSSTTHPLLTQKLTLSNGDTLYTGRLSLTNFPYLIDHAIFSYILFPGAAFCELLMAVAQEQFGVYAFSIENFALTKALIIREHDEIEFQTIMKNSNDSLDVKIYAKYKPESEWVCYCTANVKDNVDVAEIHTDIQEPKNQERHDACKFYDIMNANGIHYGDKFQVIKEISYS